MARGHRGHHGRHGHHHHGHHHHHRHFGGSYFHHGLMGRAYGMRYGTGYSSSRYYGGPSRGGSPATGLSIQATFDSIARLATPPILSNGVFTFVGSHMSAVTQLDNYPSLYRSYANQTNGTPAPPITEANLTIVGNKTTPSNTCCQILTFILAALLIFPFFFMCCKWWKKITYAKYEVNPESYRAISRLVRQAPELKTMNLVVVDNAFDHGKAGIIYDMLSSSLLISFTLRNLALDIDYCGREATDFKNNMQPIKSLPLTSTIEWGDMQL